MDKMRELQSLLRKIPKGKITTYKILAQKMNLNPREVGRLLSLNPEPIAYPCFKVINSNGNLGGYSGDGGVSEKVNLLKKDGIEIINNKIDIKKHCFYF